MTRYCAINGCATPINVMIVRTITLNNERLEAMIEVCDNHADPTTRN